MFDAYYAVLSAHFVGAALLLKVLDYLLPACVTEHYTCAAHFLLYLIIARYTFVLTKRRLLGERISPDNRAVLVTGCDSGFGHALAKRLDEEGYDVFASCLFPDNEGAKELSAVCSARTRVFGMDVAKDDSVGTALQYVKENLGTSELWAVVNNAGVNKGCAAELSSMQDFIDCMQVNGFGPVRVTKAFLPLLRQSKGRVVNLTSIGGRGTSAYFTPYVMSKWAACAFNDCLRAEMEVWGVRVISIEPEAFSTPMFNGKSVGRTMGASMSTIPEDLKADYGADFLQKLRDSAEFTFNMSSDKIYKVVDGLFDAVSREHPDLTYHPHRNIFMRLFTGTLLLLPANVQDCIRKAIEFASGVPTPASARRS